MTAEPFVSMVPSATSTECRDVEARKIIEAIRTGRYLGKVEAIRSRYAEAKALGRDPKKEVCDAKRDLPGALWSGRFRQRKADAIEQHSGLLVADLDDLDEEGLWRARAALEADPHVYALFTSPTGTGLKAVYRVEPDPARQADSFRAVSKRVRELCGVDVDASGKDLGRLCFVSYDPKAFFNDGASVLHPLPSESQPQRSPSNTTVNLTERQRLAVQVLGEVEWDGDSSGFCVCPGRDLHTNSNGPRDCQVFLDGAPTVHCVHNSCRGQVEEANRRLRSLVGKAESPVPRISPTGADRKSVV